MSNSTKNGTDNITPIIVKIPGLLGNPQNSNKNVEEPKGPGLYGPGLFGHGLFGNPQNTNKNVEEPKGPKGPLLDFNETVKGSSTKINWHVTNRDKELNKILDNKIKKISNEKQTSQLKIDYLKSIKTNIELMICTTINTEMIDFLQPIKNDINNKLQYNELKLSLQNEMQKELESIHLLFNN